MLLLLVVAVVVVRPGSQAPGVSLIVPSPDSTRDAPPIVEDVAMGPSVLPPGLTIAEIPLSPAGLGPLWPGSSTGAGDRRTSQR